MSKFIDNESREWRLDINCESIERVHEETNVSIHMLLENGCQPLAELVQNMAVMANVCYILCDAETLKVGRKQFCQAIKGDTFDRMVDAFLKELTLFFPDARRRAAIEKIMQSWQNLREMALDRLSTEMATIDPVAIANVALTRIMSKPSTSLPATSASSPEG